MYEMGFRILFCLFIFNPPFLLTYLWVFVIQGWGSAGSPQSTLCAMGSGCGCKHGSGGSPNGHFQGSHPQLTLDLLYAAAGEVSKMRMNEESYGFGPLTAPPRKPSSVSLPLKNREHDVGVYQQLQASQVSTILLSSVFSGLCFPLCLMEFVLVV